MCDYACFQPAPPMNAKELLELLEKKKQKKEMHSEAGDEFIRDNFR